MVLKWTNSLNPFCYVHPSLLLSPVGDIDSSVHVNCVFYSGYCNHTQCIVGSGPTLKLIQDGGERQVEDRACCRKALNEVFNRKFFFSVRLRRNWCWVEVVRVLGAFIKSSRVTDSCGESLVWIPTRRRTVSVRQHRPRPALKEYLIGRHAKRNEPGMLVETLSSPIAS